MDEMDAFLATVDEFVDDEERIVTYKWLSRQLAVDVNKSKNILQCYIDSCKKQENRIHVVYSIIGRNSNGMCVKVVRDDDLETVKSKLDTVFSTSLYSVQKMKLPDSAALYSADYDTDHKNLGENSKLGGIVYNGSTKLSKNENKRQKKTQGGTKGQSLDLQKQFAKPAPEKDKTFQQKANFFSKGKTSPPKKMVKVETPPPEKQNKDILDTKKSSAAASKTQKKGVAAFLTQGKMNPFSKTQTTLKAVKEEPENVEEIEKKVEKKGEKEKCSKPTQKSSPEKKQENDKKTSEKSLAKSKNGSKETKKSAPSSKRSFEDDDLKIDDFSDNDDDFATKVDKILKVDTESSTKKVEMKKNEQKKATKSRTNKKGDSHVLPAKKRRRIQECISSSSGSESEDESMDIIPPSPPPVAEPIPEKILDVGINKRTKRVLKSKTFIDDEGCMVTEKVYEYQECDEAEPVANGNTGHPEPNKHAVVKGEEETKKKRFPSSSTAAQPKKQTKQASIMGFFGKK